MKTYNTEYILFPAPADCILPSKWYYQVSHQFDKISSL